MGELYDKVLEDICHEVSAFGSVEGYVEWANMAKDSLELLIHDFGTAEYCK